MIAHMQKPLGEKIANDECATQQENTLKQTEAKRGKTKQNRKGINMTRMFPCCGKPTQIKQKNNHD